MIFILNVSQLAHDNILNFYSNMRLHVQNHIMTYYAVVSVN